MRKCNKCSGLWTGDIPSNCACGGTIEKIEDESAIVDIHYNVKRILKILYEQPPKDASLIEPKSKDDSVAKGDLSLCQNCNCMTKTINGKCGKCEEQKL